jgi:Polymerase beta, Nucleotidyltransferase
VLFGSRARRDAREDSDYDVAVFLRDMGDRLAEMNRLADLSTAILDETGELIVPVPTANERRRCTKSVKASTCEAGRCSFCREGTAAVPDGQHHVGCGPE